MQYRYSNHFRFSCYNSNSTHTTRQREYGMSDKTRLNALELDIFILAKKVDLLAEMFKEYVDHEQASHMQAGKWYPEPIDTNL